MNFSMKFLSKTTARYLFLISVFIAIVGGAFLYGVAAGVFRLTPVPTMISMYNSLQELLSPSDEILSAENVEGRLETTKIFLADRLQDGLIMVSGKYSKERDTRVQIVDRAGRVIQEWNVPFSSVWEDGQGEFYHRRPVDGMYLHGAQILSNGDLVANLEHLSTFRMDACSNVVWKLDNLGHHSVDIADDGTIWVSAEKYLARGPTGYPSHVWPLSNWTVQNLDGDGNVLREIAVFDILIKNDLEGLLYMSSLKVRAPFNVSGDTLHLNDVEVFPNNTESEIFEAGDILMSLRNINTVLVADPDTYKIKFLSVGGFVRQHDPDFMDGDVISVFDNQGQTLDPKFGPPASRIIEIDARTGERRVILDGAGEDPFFTNIMGNHQRLENGNILVNVSRQGRVLEFTPEGDLAYEFTNVIDRSTIGRTYDARILPAFMDEAFFRMARQECAK